MKKLLMLGAISPFCDLVGEFKSLNIEPYICDYYVDAPAKSMGYKAFNISTTDTKALISLAKRYSIDGCVSAFSDRNIIPCMEVCEHLGTKYFFDKEIAKRFIDKINMKAFFEAIDLPITKYSIITFNEIEKELSGYTFPVVTKPVDAYGSKGITVCNNIEEVKKAFPKTLSHSKDYTDRIIVEEFYEADEISLTAWVKNGVAYTTCIYDVFRNIGDEIGLSAVSFPSKYTSLYLDGLNKLLNYIVKKSGISNGPLTLQCFIGNDGIKVSELLCRLAGGSPYLYTTYLGGPNIAKMLIQHAAGESIDYQNLESFTPKTNGGDVFYDVQVLINKKGIISYDVDLKDIRSKNFNITDVRLYYNNHAELINVPSGGVVFARLICKAKRNKSYYEIIDELNSLITVKNENGDKISFIRPPQKIDVNSLYSSAPFDFDYE